MKDKIVEFLDKSVSSEFVLKRIAFYLLLICILLGLIFFKLNEINENIVSAFEPIISSYNTEKEENVADVFIEDKFEISDTLPLFEEEKTSPTTTVQSSSELNTDNTVSEPKTENTDDKPTNTDNTQKRSFVINVNSKKIHYADCSFVNRMKEENRKIVQLSDSELREYLNNGYTLCSTCGG